MGNLEKEQPMLAKITKGEHCKWRFWQEDSYVEFDQVWRLYGEAALVEDGVTVKARIKGSSTKEFLRCFKVVQGEL